MFITKIRAGDPIDRSLSSDWWFTAIGTLTGSGVRVTADKALELPPVFACVRVIAESFAVLPIAMYKRTKSGKRTPIGDHWLLRLFRTGPNDFQSPFEWREMVQGHLALRGNAFNQITRNGAGEILDLLPLHPDRMKIELLAGGAFRYRYTTQAGDVVYYRPDEIWHLRGLSSDGYVGLSPLDLAREAIGEGLAMQSFSSRFYANDARPAAGWIENPGRFRDNEAKRKFRDSWQELQGGNNRGKVAVLEGGMKYHEVGISPEQAQFVEMRGRVPGAIASIFRVPPHKIGDLSKATFSNIEQQSMEFWTDCIHPWCERWESSAETFLLGDPSIEVEFDMRGMMRGDSVARSAYYTSGINGGWMTRNEARAAEGLPPLEGLDEPLQPLNMTTAGAEEDGEPTTPNDDAPPQPAAPPDEEGDSGRARARLALVLQSNAARMARRIVAGNVPGASMLADAMGINTTLATSWLAEIEPGLTEPQIIASLVTLGERA